MMFNGAAGHYTNTLKLVITDTTKLAEELEWLKQNKIDKEGWNLVTIYGTSPMQNPNFGKFALDCYLNKIRLAIAFTAMSEVNATFTYNNKQTDPRKKIIACVTEYEDYTTSNGGGDKVYFKNLLEQSSEALHAVDMLLGVYQGWSTQYEAIVKNADFVLLTVYRTNAQMASLDDAMKYLRARLTGYAAACKLLGKIIPISPLASTEKVFSQDYFKPNAWRTLIDNFTKSYATMGTADMKQYLIMNQMYVFVSAFSKISKPLVVPRVLNPIKKKVAKKRKVAVKSRKAIKPVAKKSSVKKAPAKRK